MKPWEMMRRFAPTQAGIGVGGYTTLNPDDKSTSVTLSGGNLIASANGLNSNANGIARSVKAISGKRYFEARFSGSIFTGAIQAAGVATSAHSLTTSLGYANPNGWAFWGENVGARHNGVTAISGSGVGGDVFGFAVDQVAGKMWIRKNGVWLKGNPATGVDPIWSNLSGTLYAAACPWGNNIVTTMRFDPATFRDPAPDGFDPIHSS